MALPASVLLGTHQPEVGEEEGHLTFFTGVYQRADGYFEAEKDGKVHVFRGVQIEVTDFQDIKTGTSYRLSGVFAKFKLDDFFVDEVPFRFPYATVKLAKIVSPFPGRTDRPRRPLYAQFFDAYDVKGRQVLRNIRAVCEIAAAHLQ